MSGDWVGVLGVGGRGSRLMFRAGQQGNVFITLGARPPAVSAGNVSDDATA